MSAAASRQIKTSLTLDEARAIVNDPRCADPLLFAAANTIISLTTALEIERHNASEMAKGAERLRRELDERDGVIR